MGSKRWAASRWLPAPAAPGGGGPTETVTTVWTKYYFYSSDGNVFEDEGTVNRVVTEWVNPPVGQPDYTAIRFGFAANERTVTHVIGEEWNTGGADYEVTFARQFRSDEARQRYLNRELDPDELEIGNTVDLSGTTPVWSDYDGNSIYADWTIDTGVVDLRSYEPGLAHTDQLAGGGAANTTYLHTSALGSTMATSNSTGAGTVDTAYTAFGERVMGQAERYGFAGAWGYQGDGDSDYMHLGHRYYNPATGRFLQRDPIGVRGGMNVYTYAKNRPTTSVDPSGLHAGGAHNSNIPGDGPFTKSPPPPTPPPPPEPKPPETTEEELQRVKRRIKILKVAITCLLGVVTGGVGSAGYLGAGVGGAAGAVGGAVGIAE